ncbi:MAG: hypothetical protein OHK0029_18940 [Armatimonadaceae bacterium]
MKHTVVLKVQEGIAPNDVGIVTEWKREIGDFVPAGEPLLTVGTVDICAGVNGVLHRKFVLPGDAVEVGEPLAVLAGVPEPLPTDEKTAIVPAPYIPGGPEEVRYLSPQEQALARHATLSVQQVPQSHTVLRVDMSEVLRLASKTGGETLPFVVHATASALARFPELNAQLIHPNELRLKRYVHIAVPFRTPAGQGYAPVFRDADKKSLMALAREWAVFREQAEAETLPPGAQRGATFTVRQVDTGGYQSALLHLPQTGGLTCAAPEPTPIALPDGTVAVRPVAQLCLVQDTRVVSEETASAYLAAVRQAIEEARFLFA